MMNRALLASAIATGFVLPAQASVYIPSKPAIIKPENIEFTKHLILGMPITMGMLAKTENVKYLDGAIDTLETVRTSSKTVNVASAATLLIAYAVARTGVSSAFTGYSVTVDGAATTLIGEDFSYTGSSINVQWMIGFCRASVSAGSRVVTLNATSIASANYVNINFYVYSVTGTPTFTKTGFVRSNTNTLSSTITAAANSFVVGYSTNKGNATNYRRSLAHKRLTTALSSATVTGTLTNTGRNWGGTAALVSQFDELIETTVSTNESYQQTFCVIT